jgi:hypothetical protein
MKQILSIEDGIKKIMETAAKIEIIHYPFYPFRAGYFQKPYLGEAAANAAGDRYRGSIDRETFERYRAIILRTIPGPFTIERIRQELEKRLRLSADEIRDLAYPRIIDILQLPVMDKQGKGKRGPRKKPEETKTYNIARKLYEIACGTKGIRLEESEAQDIIRSKDFPDIYFDSTGTRIPKKTLDKARSWKLSAFERLLRKTKGPEPERISKDTVFANELPMSRLPNQKTETRKPRTEDEKRQEVESELRHKEGTAILKRKK